MAERQSLAAQTSRLSALMSKRREPAGAPEASAPAAAPPAAPAKPASARAAPPPLTPGDSLSAYFKALGLDDPFQGSGAAETSSSSLDDLLAPLAPAPIEAAAPPAPKPAPIEAAAPKPAPAPPVIAAPAALPDPEPFEAVSDDDFLDRVAFGSEEPEPPPPPPRMEPAKADSPKAEPHKAEAPRHEPSKTEAPKAEALEARKSETPKPAFVEEEAATEEAAGLDPEEAAAEDDGSLEMRIDPQRAEMIRRLAQDMGCAAEDVVVTALDWYLDALMNSDSSAA